MSDHFVGLVLKGLSGKLLLSNKASLSNKMLLKDSFDMFLIKWYNICVWADS